MILFQALLPSGRAIRYAELDTKAYLECEDRAAASVPMDPNPAARDAKRARAMTREVMLASLRFVTEPLPIVYVQDAEGRPTLAVDVDATLAQADGKAWRAVDYVSMTSEGSPTALLAMFSKPADYAAVAMLMDAMLQPERSLAVTLGKVTKVAIATG